MQCGFTQGVADAVGGQTNVRAAILDRHLIQRQFVKVGAVLGLVRRFRPAQHSVLPSAHLHMQIFIFNFTFYLILISTSFLILFDFNLIFKWILILS